MNYVAEIKGDPRLLEEVAPCLAGDYARLCKLDGRWVLRSSTFDECKTGQEVFRYADELVSRLHAIFGIYLQLHELLSVNSILWLDDQGHPYRKSLRQNIDVQVYSAEGVRELASRFNGESLGAMLPRLAASNVRLKEALSLLGDRPLQWSQIYDLIEFFGGVKEIGQAGWASETELDKIRRTANYYRHLGRTKKNPLPRNPPSIHHARVVILNMLKRWITSLTSKAALATESETSLRSHVT